MALDSLGQDQVVVPGPQPQDLAVPGKPLLTGHLFHLRGIQCLLSGTCCSQNTLPALISHPDPCVPSLAEFEVGVVSSKSFGRSVYITLPLFALIFYQIEAMERIILN